MVAVQWVSPYKCRQNRKNISKGVYNKRFIFDNYLILGKGKIIIVSKYKTATVGNNSNKDLSPPVFPVFVFVDTYGTVSIPNYPGFNQIDRSSDNLTIHGGSFIFKVPEQNYDVIDKMKKSGMKLKLALYRSLDCIYSDTKFDFDYHHHELGCPFCIIREGMLSFFNNNCIKFWPYYISIILVANKAYLF